MAENHDLIIIGAGPAGLFCGIHCGMAGLKVRILEKNPSPGRKLLIAGSGRCNITGAGDIADFTGHYGDAGRFVKPALYHFSNAALMEFFESRGLGLAEMKDGKIFPVSQDSRDVLKVLIDECARFNVAITGGETVRKVSRAGEGFETVAESGTYLSGSVLIATGGKSYPATGSTGDGYAFAESLGHAIAPTAPSLAPLVIKNYAFVDCAGISLGNADIALLRNGRKVRKAAGDVLFTHKGLSGPGILDFSRYVLPGDRVTVRLAGESPEEFESLLDAAADAEGAITLKIFLSRLLVPERLALAAARFSGVDTATKLSQLDRKGRRSLVANFTALPFVVERTGDYSEAMATRGGLSLREVNGKTMESKLVPGLYFAGEVLDVDGDTGGYNLQFAFSSGKLAADAIIAAAGRGRG